MIMEAGGPGVDDGNAGDGSSQDGTAVADIHLDAGKRQGQFQLRRPLHNRCEGAYYGADNQVENEQGGYEDGETEKTVTEQASRENIQESDTDAEDAQRNDSNGTRTFLAIKTAYFLFFSGRGSLLPFMPVYLSYLGFNVMQIAKIRGLDPLIGIFVAPIFGSLADRFGKHKMVLVSCILGTGLVYGTGLFLPLLNRRNATDDVVLTNVSSLAGNGLLLSGNAFKSATDAEETFGTCCRLHEPYDVLACNTGIIFCYHCNATSEDPDPSSFRVSIDSYQENMSFCNGTSNNHLQRIYNFSIGNEFRYRHCNQSYEEGFSGSQLTCCLVVYEDSQRGNLSLLPANASSVSNEKDTTHVFVAMVVIVLLGEICIHPTVPLLDSATMALINEYKEKGEEFQYGRQRLWASLAYVIVPPSAGLAIDLFKKSLPECFNVYLPAFVLFMVTTFLSATVTFLIPYAYPPGRPKTLYKNVVGLLRIPEILVFLLTVFIDGIFIGLINNYLFVFLHELKRVDGFFTLAGLTLTVTSAAEIPLMFLVARVINILGHRGIIGLGLIAYALTFLAYSFLYNPWHVLFIELLRSLTTGFTAPAYISYANEVSPPEIAATTQSIVSCARRGLGRAVGTFLGGAIYHSYGGRVLFRGAAVASCLTLIFYWTACFVIDRCGSKPQYQKLP